MSKQMMMAAVLAAVLGGAGEADAMVRPQWERPILSAEMEKTNARGYFEQVLGVRIVLTKQDRAEGPTGIRLSYEPGITVTMPPGTPRTQTVDLEIVDVSADDCGTVEYVAQLKGTARVPREGIQRRFSVVLKDHSRRVCENVVPAIWEARVREGYGWCGTMDATMSLQGNPEPVYTVQ